MSQPRKEFTTKSGLTLPLLNLKGKEYLLAQHRILWFVTENTRFSMKSEFITLTDDRAVAKVTLNILDDSGNTIRTVEGIKSEDKKDFADFAEKANTGAFSRALSYIGYGTQFSGDELNEIVNEKGVEVHRLADAPVAVQAKPKQEVKPFNIGFAGDLLTSQPMGSGGNNSTSIQVQSTTQKTEVVIAEQPKAATKPTFKKPVKKEEVEQETKVEGWD